MSVFHFPRINVKGLIQINVGTANNDDYSLQNVNTNASPAYTGYSTVPQGNNWGQSLRLANSATVQPYVFNDESGNPMNDEQMVAWMQQPSNFAAYNNGTGVNNYAARAMMPVEWNYYGNMGMNMMNTNVVGVTVPDPNKVTGSKVYTSNDPFGLIGGTLSFNNRPDNTGRPTAMLIDINPESTPASQVFADNLMLQVGQNVLFNAKPTKAVTRWVNFQRNTALTGPNGASGTFQCVIPLTQLIGQPIVEILQSSPAKGKALAGLVFRYTLFRSLQGINGFNLTQPQWLQALTDLYANQGVNPTYVQVSGTIAPWYADDMQSMMMGSYLVPANSFTSPGGNAGPTHQFQLAPAVVNWEPENPQISIDLTASLPDSYNDPTYNPQNQDTNSKFNIGNLMLGQQIGGLFNQIGPYINYLDWQSGDAAGWIFDAIATSSFSREPQPSGADFVYPQFALNTDTWGQLLLEQQLLLASDQSGCYAEQSLTPVSPGWKTMPPLPKETDRVCSQGYMDSYATFRAYSWGRPLTKLMTFDVWMMNQTYQSTPMPPSVLPLPVLIMKNYLPDGHVKIPTDTAGVFIITITQSGSMTADDVYNNFNVTTWPMINVRILPNQEYSTLFTFDGSGNPVPTSAMNWDALYQNVFRNYYMLYPGMSKIVPLNQPQQWIGPTLFTLLDRVDTKAWNAMTHMPRTRDMSATRRWLVQAYITQFVTQGASNVSGHKPSNA